MLSPPCYTYVTSEYILAYTYNTKHWKVCTEINHVYPSTYKYIHKKGKMYKLPYMSFELKSSHMQGGRSHHYAMRINTLVKRNVCARYIYLFMTLATLLYLLAGVRRQARVQQHPPLQPWCHWSGHQLGFSGSPTLMWSTAWKLPSGARPQPDWETGPSRRVGRFQCTWHTRSVSLGIKVLVQGRPPGQFLDLPWVPRL